MREARINQIRSEALRQFSRKGLFATKIQDIASGVNMSQGLIYHYYKSKEEIFVELINDALDKMNEAVFYLKGLSIPPHEKIRFAIEQLIHTISDSKEFSQTCRLITQATNSDAIPEEAKKIIEEKRDIPYFEISKIMEEGQKEGTIIMDDPRELSVAFWTAINGIALLKSTHHKEITIPSYNILLRMFIKKEYL